MKIIIILATGILALTVASCTKCLTCTAYYADGFSKGQPSANEAVTVCDKADQHAYETGTNFTLPTNDTVPVYFLCK